MHLLEYYYKKIIRYDLINKFPKNNNLKKIPKLKKIVLNLGCENLDLKKFLSNALFLELCASSDAKITRYRKSDIVLQIRKGTPAGCKAVLKGKLMYSFLNKLLSDIFPRIESFKKLSLRKKSLSTYLSFSIEEIAPAFSEFEEHYDTLDGANLPKLDVTLVTDSTSKEEFMFLIESFKLPVSVN
jgi:ribosomal protein L5